MRERERKRENIKKIRYISRESWEGRENIGIAIRWKRKEVKNRERKIFFCVCKKKKKEKRRYLKEKKVGTNKRE